MLVASSGQGHTVTQWNYTDKAYLTLMLDNIVYSDNGMQLLCTIQVIRGSMWVSGICIRIKRSFNALAAVWLTSTAPPQSHKVKALTVNPLRSASGCIVRRKHQHVFHVYVTLYWSAVSVNSQKSKRSRCSLVVPP